VLDARAELQRLCQCIAAAGALAAATLAVHRRDQLPRQRRARHAARQGPGSGRS
jgi:hypothetical protein